MNFEPHPESRRKKNIHEVGRAIAPIASIVLLGLYAYSNSFHTQFVFDDFSSITENPLVQNLDNFLSSWIGYRANPNRFIGNLTFAMNYRFGLLDTTGYHIVNFCIHALNALLLYTLVVLSFKTPHLKGSFLVPSSRSIAFAASALFVTHPIQTGAVTYIVQRLTSLATLFYLFTLVQYIWWRLGEDSRRVAWLRRGAQYSIVLLTAVLAMKTKEIAFTLPVVICLYEFFFFGASGKNRLPYLVPILATILIIPLTMLSFHIPASEVLSEVSEMTKIQSTVSRLDYLRTEIAVIARYLRLLVIPTDQNVDYDFPLYHSFIEPRVLTSLILILLMTALAIYFFRKSALKSLHRTFDPATRLISFGILWFFVTLLVESSLIPIVDVIFEHRVYLPSVGFLIAAATAGAFLARKISPAHQIRTFVGASILISLALAVTTSQRNYVWADDLSLWTDAVRKSPNKSRPYNNLGFALMRRRNVDSAIEYYLIALKIDPNNPEAHNNLGVAYSKTSKSEQAIFHFRIAIALRPDYAQAHSNLGAALAEKGEMDSAIEYYQIALGINPNSAGAHNNLGVAYYKKGLVDQAIAQFQVAIALKPNYSEAHNNLGIAYGKKGWVQQAAEEISVGMKIQSRGGH